MRMNASVHRGHELFLGGVNQEWQVAHRRSARWPGWAVQPDAKRCSRLLMGE